VEQTSFCDVCDEKKEGDIAMTKCTSKYWLLLGSLTIALEAHGLWPISAQDGPATDWDRHMLDAEAAYSEGNYDEAEKQADAAVRYGKRFWPNGPRTARSLGLLGQIYHSQGKNAEAEKPLKESLAIWKEVFGPERVDLVVHLDDMAQYYQEVGKYPEAEQLYQQGLTVMERAYGKESDIVALRLEKLAGLDYAAGWYEKAEPLYKRALKIRRNVTTEEDLTVAKTLENYAKVLRKLNRAAEAEDLEARAKAIRKAQ
jgi:tetratricopeptide (TPR) repeat protein